tara:strand:+ start:1065 stop:1457 length:393 start_codon:yes stop_codon:yes gene_type:complete
LASRRHNHQEDALLRTLRLLSTDPMISTRKIAKSIGVSNGSAYYVLSALINKGFVKLENFKNNPKKTQYVYLLTPAGIREKSTLTYRFIKRKKKEFEDLRKEIGDLEKEAGIDELSISLNKDEKYDGKSN